MKRLLNEPIQFFLGDVIRLKKPHACGGFDWEVTRLGLDTGLKCTTCSRRIMLARLETERRFRQFITRGDPQAALTPVSESETPELDG